MTLMTVIGGLAACAVLPTVMVTAQTTSLVDARVMLLFLQQAII